MGEIVVSHVILTSCDGRRWCKDVRLECIQASVNVSSRRQG